MVTVQILETPTVDLSYVIISCHFYFIIIFFLVELNDVYQDRHYEWH